MKMRRTASLKLVKLARQIKKLGTGYSQGAKQRWSVFNFILGVLVKLREVDCSAAFAGLVDLVYGTSLHTSTLWTGNAAAKIKSTGFFHVRAFTKLSAAVAGGALLTPGRHIVTVLDEGEVLSPEYNERGKTTGGKAGDQTGREVRIRTLYNRSGGWKYNIVPVTPEEFAGQALALFAAGKSYADALRRLLIVTADGKRFAKLITAWAALDAGLTVAHTAAELPAVPQSGHAFVVLGGTIPQMRNRLTVALPAILANPASKIIVTGGVKRDGQTEAAWMRRWLTDRGIDDSRIIIEGKASSTIGNAANSVPLMLAGGITSCTIVTYDSHQRRAAVLFRAAKVGAWIDQNKTTTLAFLTPLAYPDKDIAGTKASSATRAEIGKEVAYLLGLSKHYKEKI